MAPASSSHCQTALMENPSADAWQTAWVQAEPDINSLARSASRTWPLQVLRSSQMDAARLDGELTAMLNEQFMKIFSFFQSGRVAGFEPELNAVLLLLIFRLSVWKGKATPGSQLLNLRYRNEYALSNPQVGGKTGVEGPALSVLQRLMFGFGYVLVPYVWNRLGYLASRWEWSSRGYTTAGTRAWRAMQSLETAVKLAALGNVLLFLKEGKYRSLLERLVGARLVYQQPTMTRIISFEYLNRQLVWQELSEFLLFMLPLVDVSRIKRTFASYLPRLPNPALLLGGMPTAGMAAASTATASGGGRWGESDASNGTGDSSAMDKGGVTRYEATSSATDSAFSSSVQQTPTLCPVCASQEILVPFVAIPCCHVFCYCCLRSNCHADKDFACPLDGVRVRAMHRWTPNLTASSA